VFICIACRSQDIRSYTQHRAHCRTCTHTQPLNMMGGPQQHAPHCRSHRARTPRRAVFLYGSRLPAFFSRYAIIKALTMSAPYCGKQVTINGLQSKPELNGTVGTAASYDNASGRCKSFPICQDPQSFLRSYPIYLLTFRHPPPHLPPSTSPPSAIYLLTFHHPPPHLSPSTSSPSATYIPTPPTSPAHTSKKT
jgi:hypothetical protein